MIDMDVARRARRGSTVSARARRALWCVTMPVLMAGGVTAIVKIGSLFHERLIPGLVVGVIAATGLGMSVAFGSLNPRRRRPRATRQH